jgi:hypothetical protein
LAAFDRKKRMHQKALPNLYLSLNNLALMKSKRTRGGGHTAQAINEKYIIYFKQQ